MTFWSISLFDQSVLYFYLCLAAIQSIVRQPDVIPIAMASLAVSPPPRDRLSVR
jgi:hypothetical protein